MRVRQSADLFCTFVQVLPQPDVVIWSLGTCYEGYRRVDGTAELLQLIELLRLGAATTRQIADMRMRDRDELYRIVEEAERMADNLQRICDRPHQPN